MVAKSVSLAPALAFDLDSGQLHQNLKIASRDPSRPLWLTGLISNETVKTQPVFKGGDAVLP